jgi:type IV pilus assembly protein PilE
MNLETFAARRRDRGFTLIDLVIAIAIIGILLRVAFPSYQAYVVRSSRQSAQGELLALANAQERIFLNSNAYTSSMTGAYTGQSSGGLGLPAASSPTTSGKSKDDRYTIAVTTTATTFTLTATPKSGTSQVGDGNLTITEAGVRTWGSKSW